MPHSLLFLGALRFLMGWGIPSAAVNSALLVRWFPTDKRAIAIAFPLGFGFFGLTPGGFLAHFLQYLPLNEVYYITVAASFVGFCVSLSLIKEPLLVRANDAVSETEKFGSHYDITYKTIWRSPYVWLIGFASNAQTWAMFTISAFLPIFLLRDAGFSQQMVGKIMSFYGVYMLIIAFSGALLMSRALHSKKQAVLHKLAHTASDFQATSLRNWATILPFRTRIYTMIIGLSFTFIGFAFLALFATLNAGHVLTYRQALVLLFFVAFMVLTAVAFWSLPGDMFPEKSSQARVVGIVLFALAIVANIGATAGPFLSSYLLALGWKYIFAIGALVQLVGILCSLIVLSLNRKQGRLPFVLYHEVVSPQNTPKAIHNLS
jgi:MFS family permease